MLAGVELDADHEALPAHVGDEPGELRLESGEAGERLLAPDGRVFDEAALEELDGRERRGAGDRIATVGRAMCPRAPRLEELGAGDHGAEGHARRDALGGEQDVRLHAPVLDGPHLPGPTGAGLDLVGDEQAAVLVADAAQALEEAVLRDDVPALALDRLEDDRGDLVRRRQLVEQDLIEPAQVLHATVRRVEDAGEQRAEPGVVLRLGRRQRDRPVRPAVEGAEEGDDVRPLRREPGQLDRCLDDLRP